MRPVSQAAIDRWIAENERGICGSTVKKRQGIERPQLQCVDKRQAEQPVALHKQDKPWYQREPLAWFKPLFAVLVWCYKQRIEIARMALAGAVGVALGLLMMWAW